MSVISDPVLSGQFLKSRGWPLYTGSPETKRTVREMKKVMLMESMTIMRKVIPGAAHPD